ncbi:anti-sigma factor antagonist [Aquipuribacter nitratireducens]|uniref:Anti-sigma factor antagonist n=1 Tax=Aquipuribacter nitratireducens TaxID=650104 RepID=A0ABW0GPI4_9MICO
MDIGTTRTDDGLVVVSPVGRLTMVSAPQLRAVVTACVTTGDARVVVDMSAVEFIDSSGLGALVAGLKAARQGGGDLRIARLAPQVLTVLQLTNLDRVMRPYASVEEAFGG